MNKSYFLLFALLLCFVNATAVPAYPYPIEVAQPDGTTLTVTLKGDEFASWAESEDGYTLLRNSNHAFEYAVKNAQGDIVPSGRIAKNPALRSAGDRVFLVQTPKKLCYSISQTEAFSQLRQIRQQALENYQMRQSSSSGGDIQSSSVIGTVHAPVILVQFPGKPFTKNQTDFLNLCNQVNYNLGTATGSVHDYFLAASYSQLDFQVDVYGPYTLAHTIDYYDDNSGASSSQVTSIVVEATTLAQADGCNFANYDSNNDGKVDGIHLIYAGYDQSAGALAGTAIWATAWSTSGSFCTRNGKTVPRFSMSSELRSTSGTTIAPIGTIAHELSHVFGLPDLYDTDYADSGGQSVHIGEWDIMASGSWNNHGDTPPYHSAWCRDKIGWVPAVELTDPAIITLPNPATTGAVYKITTATAGEYFLIENRQKQAGWEYYIPASGMLIYHVDENVGTHTTWGTGWRDININPAHRGLYIKQAGGGAGSASSTRTTDPYPYNTNDSFTDTSIPNSKSWAGANTAKPVTEITRNTAAKTVTFTFMGGPTSCPRPMAISASSITASGAVINWTPSGTETQWQFQYSVTADFSGASIETLEAATKTLSGLNSNTQYYIRARAVCTDENSIWREGNFRTECGVYDLPLIENFENAYPSACWTEYGDDVFIQNTVQNHTTVGSKSIRYTENSTYKMRGLVTPRVTLSANGAIFSFYLRTDEFWGQSNYYHTYRVKVSTTNNQTSSFTTIKEFSTYNYSEINANNVILTEADIENSWYHCETDLSAYAGQTIYVALEAYDHYGAATTCIDDIEIIALPPTAPTVETLAATDITQTSATINKTVNTGTETIVEQGFKYRKVGNSNWETSTNGMLTDLTPNTEYEFYAYANTVTYQISGDTLTFSTLAHVAPVVVTLAATDRTLTSATLNKSVTAGTETITAQGFKYKKTSDSTWETSTNGVLTDLTPNTEYQFYAFATTATYPNTNGNTLTFSTLAHIAPVVVTLAATDITQTSATLNKSVTAGTETITEQGFKYRKVGDSNWETSTNGILTNLTPNIEYEFYAYANTATYPSTNGNTLIFSTLAHVAPTVETLAATNITQTSATLNKSVIAGTETIVEQGFKYRKVGNSNWETSTNGILTNLTPNIEYEFYAYANTATYPSTNGVTLTFSTLAHTAPVVVTLAATDITQTSATLNKTVNTGTETIVEQGFKYRKVGNSNWETSTNGILTNLTPNIEYEFYAYANTATYSSTNGVTLTFSTLAHVAPVVVTLAATDITQTSATLNKSVTAGTETITEQGFKYRKVGDSNWETSANGILTDLTPNTEYEFYAYATTATYPSTNGVTLTFSTLTSATGIDDILENSVSIYPNPVEKELYVGSENEIGKIEILDIAGKSIYHLPSIINNAIDVSTLPSGVYFIKITVGNKIVAKKFVKK